MLERLRTPWRSVIRPLAEVLHRLGASPSQVTWVGTLACVLAALATWGMGYLWQGSVAIAVCVLGDSLDGELARITNSESRWGAFLDSTLDRIADATILAVLAWHCAYYAGSLAGAALAVVALIAGQVTSYVKARGEALGAKVTGGLATRADRLAIVLAGAFVADLVWFPVVYIALAWLCVAGGITIAQRMRQVRQELE
ncbi:MAG: CDP-diacylglycerol--glycerol-3-phosphate 3-phosphatidyltransferase [Propionibacteriales bacterium]|nr:MAG: CDP-diacylglycerol--glycerol-3-phosphate 3-phosphatidyltransferase [Propionibacteriales bacterium]